MQREKMQGLGRMLRAFGSSAKGLTGALREEQAFRQELMFACVALPLALWLGHSGVERALLAGSGTADSDRRAAQQCDRGHRGPHRPGAP